MPVIDDKKDFSFGESVKSFDQRSIIAFRKKNPVQAPLSFFQQSWSNSCQCHAATVLKSQSERLI
jgi:hypothetical protein